MAANKPVKKGTAQTEKKAKGLLADVGNYKGKTLNLRKSQLGKAGQAAAGARKIAISRTKYDKETKKVIGPMGKPITGRVDLGGGNIAVYKNGVRVRAQKPSQKPSPKPSSGDGGDGSKTVKGAGDRGTNRGPMMQSERKKRIIPPSNMASSGKLAGMKMVSRGKPGVGPGGTYTKSYERSAGGRATIPSYLSTVDQRRREVRRIAARKKAAGSK